MGLAADLSYAHPAPNLLQRSVQAAASTRPGAWFFSKTLARMDRVVNRRLHGRVSLTGSLAGLPALVLTTTGRRSGTPRRTHLIAVPFADTLALLGTNFGQRSTPAWVLNLESDPAATVSYRGVTRAVRARPASPAEAERVLAASAATYKGYLRYQQRITGRRLRIFVLEVTAPD